MDNRISYTVKKTKATRSTRNLIKEMFREEKDKDKYDNGVRQLKPEKTKDNVWLEKPDAVEFDRERKEKIKTINQKRSERKEEDGYTAYDRRRLRSDTVDLLSQVIQPSIAWLNSHSEEEGIELLEESYKMMKDHPELYGEVKAAVIHVDESSMHMQVLSSTLDMENLRSKAKELVGNQKHLSDMQTIFANGLKERGYDVERGINRYGDTYLQWVSKMKEKYGVKITRYNENDIMELERQEEEFKQGIEDIAQEVGMLDADGNYYITDEDGNSKPMNIKDMIVADAVDVGNKAFEKYKRMHDADMEFMEEEYDEKLKAKEERNKELEQQAKNYKESAEMELKTAGSLRKEQQSYRDEIESLKIELSTTKEESERLKQSNNTLKQSNSHLENKNAQLRQENEQLSTRNRFLDDLSNIDNDKNIKHQDEAIVAYLRHDKYKNDSKGFSDLVHRSMNFVDKSAQRRYGSHMQNAPMRKAKTKDNSRELEL